ncbi:hypothetical protein D3C80_1737660 [compost metagenome]
MFTVFSGAANQRLIAPFKKLLFDAVGKNTKKRQVNGWQQQADHAAWFAAQHACALARRVVEFLDRRLDLFTHIRRRVAAVVQHARDGGNGGAR